MMNHGVDGLDLFISSKEARFFLSRLALQVKVGRLKVHSFSLMPNHFHLLLESLMGELSKSMKEIQQGFAVWFNKAKDRRGPLFRSRFKSVLVASDEYLWTLLAYIDMNPVKAGIVSHPEEYPFGSVRIRASKRQPPWLSPPLALGARGAQGKNRRLPGGPAVSGRRELTKDQEWLIERWLEKGTHGIEGLGGIHDRGKPGWRDWLIEEAGRNRRGYPPVLPPERLLSSLGFLERGDPHWRLKNGTKGLYGWKMMRVGLLRMACGLGFEEIKGRLESTMGSVTHLFRRHREYLGKEGLYRERAGEVLFLTTAEIFAVRGGK